MGDTGRSIKEVEMYLAGLTYREVLESAGKDIGRGVLRKTNKSPLDVGDLVHLN